MKLCRWEELPDELRTEAVRPYYESLKDKRGQLAVKRVFDVIVSGLMLVILSPLFLILAVMIRLDSPGPVFYRQTRVTQYGKEFRIFKFRTMVDRADQMGTQVTVSGDARVTCVGKLLRGGRLDELSQLIDVFRGAMSFVGTRPEVPKYVAAYTPEMMATLLLPAGVTSRASIEYKDEAVLLDSAEDADRVYTETILPEKMKYNLQSLLDFSLKDELRIMLRTVAAVAGKGGEETTDP